MSSHRLPTFKQSPTTDACITVYGATPLNPIFMLGGAPEAHEVLSKTPRIEIPLRAKVCPEAFPIKASDNPGAISFCLNLEFQAKIAE